METVRKESSELVRSVSGGVFTLVKVEVIGQFLGALRKIYLTTRAFLLFRTIRTISRNARTVPTFCEHGHASYDKY